MKFLLRLLFWVALTGPLGATEAPLPATIDFNRDVRPILSDLCFKCHGFDDKAREAGRRLDTIEGALAEKDGIRAIVPGKLAESDVHVRIHSKDRDEAMPPLKSGKKLTTRQMAVLDRWIEQGAPYRKNWAFEPIRPQVPPATGTLGSDRAEPSPSVHRAGQIHPIDAFIRARLEKEGLQPAPEAEPHILVRRLYLDMIGLPPTPEEADQFVAAAKADEQQAVEQLVDQLLARPQYGERWARRWLDLARYADTNGYEKDRPRSIWPWRDWVIQALNADLPFDQFTIEQLAGDMLPNATPAQIIATGFHRNTMLNEEGGIDPMEYRFLALTDRVATTGATWMGMTVGCAQCHTHKYDPILHREYYQLMAFLDNADEPDFAVRPPDYAAQRADLEKKIAQAMADLPSHFKAAPASKDSPHRVTVTTASGEKPEQLPDGSWLLGAAGPETDTYTITIDSLSESITGIRLEALPDPKLPGGGPGRSSTANFVLTHLSVTSAAADGTEQPEAVKISRAEADFSQNGFPVEHAINGQAKTGWAIAGEREGQARTATFTFARPVARAGGSRLTIGLAQEYGKGHTLGRFRVSLIEKAPAIVVQSESAPTIEEVFAGWLARESPIAVHWTVLRPTTATSNLPLLTILDDNSVLASGDQTKADTYELKLRPGLRRITAVRLEALPDESLPDRGPGRVYYEGPRGDFTLTNFTAEADGKVRKFSGATESFASGNFKAAQAIDDNLQTGWSINGGQGRAHQAVFPFAAPLEGATELKLTMQFARHYSADLGRFRISVTDDPRGLPAAKTPAEIEQLLAVSAGERTAAERQTLFEHFLMVTPELAAARASIDHLRKSFDALPTTLVLRERPPANPRSTFLHKRGEFLQLGEQVHPAVPSFLPPLHSGQVVDRLAFARWLVAPENPLTARVTVNRQWSILFGRGIVKTTEDFGLQGSPPSHPELLDWLAAEFIKQGWSLKRLHRLIVTSATYRQSSVVTSELQARDPENELLARGPRGRLDAELVRDTTLAEAGLLSLKIGGPSVYPPQPEGVSETAYGSPKWNTSSGEDRHRRGLYTFAKRTAPFAMFNTFDAPTGEACVARRETSNNPLQALTLLNDLAFTEAAQALGKAVAQLPGGVEERVRAVFRRVLTRPPTDDEVSALAAFFTKQKARFDAEAGIAAQVAGEKPGPATAEQAAWTTLARAIFNLDEAITRS